MDSRPRKTTLETFNDELAILDRPIAGDVESQDVQTPPPQQWPAMSAVIMGLLVFAGAGVLFFSHPDPGTVIAAAHAAAATTPQPLPTSPSPRMPDILAVSAPEVPLAPIAAVAMEPATEAAKWRQPPPRKAWTKLRLRSSSPAPR